MSLGQGVGNLNFAGTQVGINTVGTNSGPILFDSNGSPVTRSNGTFFTDATTFFNSSNIIESGTLQGRQIYVNGDATIPIGSVVVIGNQNSATLASYTDIGNAVLGIANQNIFQNGVGIVSLGGTIQYTGWSFGQMQAVQYG